MYSYITWPDATQNIRNSNSEVMDLQKNVGKVFQDVLSGSSELAYSQLKDLEVNRALATEVRSSLEIIRGKEVEALLQTLGSMHRDLVRTITTVPICSITYLLPANFE